MNDSLLSFEVAWGTETTIKKLCPIGFCAVGVHANFTVIDITRRKHVFFKMKHTKINRLQVHCYCKLL